MRRLLIAAGVALGVLACAPPKGAPPPRSTLVIGIDISGSFRENPAFNDAIQFAALYIYGHINGMDGLKQATDVFVGSLGGEKPGQPKSFHPIQDLSGKTPDQIAADLRSWFPDVDPLTDFNAFFQRVAVHVKRQNLVLAPLNIILCSDGVPDFPGTRGLTPKQLYSKIDLQPLEFLSRSVTIRLLYGTPGVAQNWERLVPRNRVRIWTQDSDVMKGWRRHYVPGVDLAGQDSVWSWMSNLVDFRVRRGKII